MRQSGVDWSAAVDKNKIWEKKAGHLYLYACLCSITFSHPQLSVTTNLILLDWMIKLVRQIKSMK